MAEATLAPVDETPPEAVVTAAPEAPAESAPPADNLEEGPDYSAILEELSSGDAGEAGADGKGAAADGVTGPSTGNEPLTPEQIREDERRKVESETKQAQTQAERASYLAGLDRVVKDVPDKLDAFVEEFGLGVQASNRLKAEFNRLYGALSPLYQHQLQQAAPEITTAAYRQAEGEVSKLLFDTVKDELGDTSHKAVLEAKTWPDLAKAITKEARKGYVSEAKAKENTAKVLAKLDEALKPHNLSLAAITGNGGINRHNVTNGSGGIPSFGQWGSMKLEERDAWRKRDPDIEMKLR